MHVSSRTKAFTAYALILAMLWPGALMGALTLAGCVLAFLSMRRGEALYAGHGRYQLRTVGFAALALLPLMLLVKTAVGPFLLLAIKLWVVYRVLTGAYRLSKELAPV